jgi:ribosome assembly protein YihI (activator of Der GTPase)
MQQVAMKFVQWDVPELEKLKGCRVYQLREQLDNGDKLSREDKNWITRNVKECIHFKSKHSINSPFHSKNVMLLL